MFFVFEFANCSEVRIEGLETLDYLDNLCQRERFTEQGDAITFENEVKFFHGGILFIIATLGKRKISMAFSPPF